MPVFKAVWKSHALHGIGMFFATLSEHYAAPPRPDDALLRSVQTEVAFPPLPRSCVIFEQSRVLTVVQVYVMGRKGWQAGSTFLPF